MTVAFKGRATRHNVSVRENGLILCEANGQKANGGGCRFCVSEAHASLRGPGPSEKKHPRVRARESPSQAFERPVPARGPRGQASQSPTLWASDG